MIRAKRSSGAAVSEGRSALGLSLLLVLVTLAVFAATARHEFINFDDSYVTATPQVREGFSLDGLRWAWTTTLGGSWQPLTWMSHQLDCQLYGVERAGGHHLTNVLLHTASAVMLFLLLLRLTGSTWASFGAAALFAWHPLHVESVAWVFERKDVLCGLLSIVTIWAYASSLRRPTVLRRWLLVPGVFALALLSKPMAVTLPALLMLLDYWPLGRYDNSSASRGEAARRAAKLFAEKWPLWTLALIAALVTFWTQRAEGAMTAGESYPLTVRLENGVVSIGDYLRQAIWPTRLAIFYPHPGANLPLWKVLVAGLVLIAISVVAIGQRRRRPYLLVGWLWFLVTLLPVLGIVQVGEQARADRYTYLALVGLAMMVFWTLGDLVSHAPRWRRAVAGASALWLAALAVVAHVQCGYWRNSEVLFAHALAVTTDNHVAHTNLGIALQAKGDDASALDHYRTALRIKPSAGAIHNVAVVLEKQNRWRDVQSLYTSYLAKHRDAKVHLDWGTLLAEHGDTPAAIEQLATAARLDPALASAHAHLGELYLQQNRAEESIPHLRAATRLRPRDPSTWLALARGYLAVGNPDEAERLCHHARQLAPDAPGPYQFMGALFMGRGQLREAIECFAQAQAIAPNDVEIHRSLGVALVTVGDLAQAERQFQAILVVEPQNADALYNLGAVRVRQGRASEAVPLFRGALAARPAFFAAQTSLASILAEAGETAEAIALFREALKLEPKNALVHFALAQALIRAGDNSAAAEHLREALRIDPSLRAAEEQLEQLPAGNTAP
ncbi:MAG: tetratricopeptide repeat protein [Pirellulales bacterium]